MGQLVDKLVEVAGQYYECAAAAGVVHAKAKNEKVK